MTDDEAIQILFKATLSRPATSEEMATVKTLRKGTRDSWLPDLQWALINKLDFLFNY